MPLSNNRSTTRPLCRSRALLALGALLALAGCQTADTEPPSDTEPPADTEPPSATGPSLSYYESRLLDAIERKDRLEAAAADADGSDWPEIERRFRDLAGIFESIVADNPDQIEARLIYGKFLDFFGDEEGAREQWMQVLSRDHTVAVAHQQLGTFFAEEGDFGRALAYYLTAVEHDPDEPVYHFGLGELLHTYRSGFLEEAELSPEVLERQMLEAFRQAAALAPENFVYQFRYGEAFYNVNERDWEDALAHWEQLAQQDNLSSRQRGAVQLHRARVLGEMSRFAEGRALASQIDEPGLESSRDALIDAINEAETEEQGE